MTEYPLTLSQLTKLVKQGTPPKVELHAIELSLYVPFCQSHMGKQAQDGYNEPILDNNGGSLHFPSRYSALSTLAKTGLSTVTVIHTSAYDEMIGLETEPGQNKMVEEVSLHNYASRD